MKDYVVTAYWIGEKYRAAAVKLAASLDALGIPHDIRPQPEQGSWWLNMRHRPLFVREMMRAYPDRPLVVVDADCIFERRPDVLDAGISEDVAAMWWLEPNDREIAYEGTMYLAPTARVRAMVDRWADIDRIEATAPPEDSGVNEALARTQGLTMLRLHQEYCWIEIQMRKKYPDAQPRIRHHCLYHVCQNAVR